MKGRNFVYQRAGNGVGDGIEAAHSGDHEGRKDSGDTQHGAAEGSDVGQN